MAALGEDFLIGDDLDVILSLIEEDILAEDDGFTAEVEEILELVMIMVKTFIKILPFHRSFSHYWLISYIHWSKKDISKK